ncbi:AAA family ATPase [Moraxella sp. ZJ142]|uniref:AAA family ATPase n=1 Tax=Moraxella marmotae TaxID=3344520 RepID=UPI0035D42C68
MNITLKQAQSLLPHLLNNQIVPFLHSSPALGKSSLAKQLAHKAGLKVIDLRLTELDSSDLNGLPYFADNKAKYLPFDTFPITDTPIPDGFNGWLLLLDELNSALPSVQAAAYKLILDRQVGQYQLHDKAYIIACGNKDTDNAITYPMSSALVSRFAHFYIEPDTKEWTEWALDNGIDIRIISFLGFRPSHLYKFNPDSTEPYASPRTWQMLSKVLSELPTLNQEHLPLLASLLGDGVANEFMQYLRLADKVPSLDKILANPDTHPVPDEIGLQWATVSMLTSNITDANFTKLEIYLRRFSMEMQVVALRYIVKQNPQLTTKASDWIKAFSVELFG